MKVLYFRLCFSFLLLNLAPSIQGQLSREWAFTQGSNASDLTSSCKTDDQGGLYTSVVFRDTADLDHGPGVDMVYVADDEVFVLNKYTQDGDYLWSGQFKTVGNAGGFIAEIRNNRILMLVYYTDTLTYLHDTPWAAANPGQNIAVISMNLDGQIISFSHLANSHDTYFSDFISQPDGSILACGGFEGGVTFNTPDSTKTLISIGEYDSFIVRFNPDLEVEWLNLIASKGTDFAENIFVTEEGRIYFAIAHDSTIVLQTNHGQVTSHADGKDNAVFGWLKSDGTIEQAHLFGGDLGDQIRAIAADENGNIFICGYFEGDVNFQHSTGTPVMYSSINESDGFVAKYSPSGMLVWAKIFSNEDYGGVYTLRLHRGTHLYLSGTYKGRSDLDPGPDSIIVNAVSQGDVFACKLDTDGNLNWVYSFAGIGFKGIRTLIPGTDGKLYIHGYFFSTIDCDPGPNILELVSNGGSDVFMFGFTEAGVITNTADVVPTSMQIFPNPATDHLEIKADAPIEYMEVYSMNGTRLLHIGGYNQHTNRINIESFLPGLYYVRIKTDDQYATRKFVKAE